VSRRLESLGALTQGDRRATVGAQGLGLGVFNIDTTCVSPEPANVNNNTNHDSSPILNLNHYMKPRNKNYISAITQTEQAFFAGM